MMGLVALYDGKFSVTVGKLIVSFLKKYARAKFLIIVLIADEE